MAKPDRHAKPERFSLAARARSFGYAFAGLSQVVRTQHNAWIHLAATIAVVIAGFVFRLTAMEWCAVVIACGMVWSAEIMNSAIEALCDLVHPDPHPAVKRTKDMAAGAVLATAIAAAIIGAIVFVPKLWP